MRKRLLFPGGQEQGSIIHDTLAAKPRRYLVMVMARTLSMVFLLWPVFAAHAQANIDCSHAGAADPANATYTIEGDTVTLVNGVHAQPVGAGSHTSHATRLIEGAQACGQFGDQRATVVLLNDEPGGSGSYDYVAVVMPDGHSVPAVLLGDRIRPESVVVENNMIVVTFLDRAADAPMSDAPSVKTVRRFGLQGGHLVDQP
jgi:hypothetical protein